MAKGTNISVRIFTIAFAMVLQLVLTDFVNLGPFIGVTLLPAIIVCLPTSLGAIPLMLICFGMGAFVDIFSEGVCGLNSLALVWVGLLRNFLIHTVIDKDIIDRGLPLSRRKYPEEKILLVLFALCLVFCLVFNLADLVGYRSFGFIMLRTFLSALVSSLAGYLVCISLLVR